MDTFGALRARERPKMLARVAMLVLSLIVVASSASCVALFAWLLFDLAPHTDTKSTLVFGALMLAGSLAMVTVGTKWARTFGRWLPNPLVSVYENGITSESRGVVRMIAWSDLEEVVFGIVRTTIYRPIGDAVRSTTYRMTLRSKNTTIVLTESLSLTASALETARYELGRRVPVAIARVRAGETLGFGRVAVGPDAVVIRGVSIPWSEVRRFGMKEGFYTVTAKRKRSCAIDRISNVDVFDAVCTERLTAHHGR
jgi:hypothetical protein